MDVYGRGVAIVQGLEALGTRAYLDPSVATPPCVLVVPPNLVFDLQCDAVTAEWQLVALAAAASTADRTTWQSLQLMVQNVALVADVEGADLVSYILNGRAYPAYILTFSEGVN